MKERDKSATIDGETRISVIAAGFLAGAYALVEQAVMEPNPLGRHESVGSISSSIGEMRESLKLVGPLYHAKELRAWSRRFRMLGLDLRPVRESDRIIEGLRANRAAAGPGGQRAVAFLAGHYMVLSDLQAAYAANRLERFDVIGKERSFAKFASAPKGGTAGKVRLRAFAAVILNERMDVLESWIEAASAADARDVWASLQTAVCRSLVALDLSAGCYDARSLDVARRALRAIGEAVARVGAADAVLDVVSDPDMGARAAVAGVLPEDLADLKVVLESARSVAV
ncbi:MAG TPA: hypothetical protein VIK83_04190, partial [Coriobacteriia bacterium]